MLSAGHSTKRCDPVPVTGKIHSFESFGTLDGPGIRFVVFLQGCPLRCKFCHNPDTWDPAGGMEKSVEEVVAMISSCRSFLRNGGVTLSGGEPLLQAAFSRALLEACSAAGFHTALDTAGSLPLEVSRPVIEKADMLLLDIKSLDNELCKALTGAENKHTLSTLDFCERSGKKVWLRHVLVPEWTLDRTQLSRLAEFLASYTCIERVELLPYHKMGSHKWAALGLQDPLETLPLPPPAETAEIRALFKEKLPGKTVV